MHKWRKTALTVLLVGWLMLTLVPSPAQADGFPIPDDPADWYHLIEDQQIAVITLKSAQEADVDMFISITDASDESHTVTFVLPFPMEPRGFAAEEVQQREFDAQVTRPLDQFIAEVQGFTDWVRGQVALCALAGDLLVGQPLYPLAPVLLIGAFGPMMPLAAGNAQQVITTEHSRTEIYNVATQADLEALIARAGLPKETADKMRRYVGRYLAIITIQTVPAPKDRRGLNALGLHFSFTTSFEAAGDTGPADAFQYAYPLSTGDVWGQPIPLTRVYAVAPSGVAMDIAYPREGRAVSEEATSQALFYEGHIRGRMEQPMHSVVDADDGQQRVWRVTYIATNPSEDVVITARSVPPNTLLVARRALARFLADWSWIGFLGLAVLVWLVLWRIVVGGLLQPGYSFFEWRYWVDALGGWFVYATIDLTLLGILGGVPCVALAFPVEGVYAAATGACLCLEPLALAIFGIAAGATGLLLARWRAPERRGRAIVAVLLQTVLAAFVYNMLAVGLVLLALLLV